MVAPPPQIAVLIVNHNGRALLPRCLASLADGLRAADGQSIPHETIVVDNASRDDSVAWLRAHHPAVRVVALDENVGFGRANNAAAARTRAPFLLLLNADAWLAPRAAGHLLAACERASDVGLSAPTLRYADGRLQFVWAPTTGVAGEMIQMLRNRFEGATWNHRGLPRLLRAAGDPGWYTAACALVRRQAFVDVAGFDPALFLYFEDVDLCLRLRAAGWRMTQATAAEVFHLKGGAGGRPGSPAYRRSQLRHYRRHRPRWEQRVLLRRLRRHLASEPDPDRRRALAAVLDDAARDTVERFAKVPRS
ncbi:MAG: glycosyltransferase family 2 protein [Acidobacteriota bacterium]